MPMTDTTTPAAEPAAAAPLTKKAIYLILTGLLLAQMLASIEGTVLATAAPTIAADLKGFEQITWVFVAYLITSTVATPLWGKLSDLLGRRRLYEASIATFMLGSVLCGASTSMTMLVWCRALQGLGAGGIFTLTMTIMGDILPPRERGKYQGFMMSVFGVSTVLGPLVGGLIVDNTTWRWIFYMNIPLGLASLALSRITLGRLPFLRRDTEIDFAGAAVLTVWVIAALLVMELGRGWGWSSARTIGTAAVAVVGLVLFVRIELRAADPIIPPHLFRERIVTVSTVMLFATGAVMFGISIYAPMFLQVVAGQRATNSGLLLIPMTLGMLVGSSGTGRLFTKTGKYKWYPVYGGALQLLAAVLLAFMQRGTSTWLTSLYMGIFGVGAGMMFIVTLVGIQNRVDVRDLGSATSTNNFCRSLGNAFGTALLGSVFITRLDSQLAERVPGEGLSAKTLSQSPAQIQRIADPLVRDGVIDSFAHSLQIVFLIGVPLCVIGFLISFLMPEYPLRTHAAVGYATDDDGEGDGRPVVVPAH
jgi:EmrB/QacA subfamily drug resistance transporter